MRIPGQDATHRAAVIPFSGSGSVGARPSWTNASNGINGAYGAAVNQNAEDYDRLQGNYSTLFGQSQEQRNRPDVRINPLSAQTRNYTSIPGYQRGEMLDTVANKLSGMSDTGGYSEGDITAFRERGLSPIRSLYASAQQNLKRQRALQGGYSPNYGAMQAKMAREQSGIIGQHTMNLNAGIAERVAEGKRFGLSQLAPIAQNESNMINSIGRANAEGMNRTEELNADDASRVNALNAQLMLDTERLNRANSSDSISQGLAATNGASNLYGTTPALTNMFGSQLLQSNGQNLQAQQATAGIRQDRANTGLNLISRAAVNPMSRGVRMPFGG